MQQRDGIAAAGHTDQIEGVRGKVAGYSFVGAFHISYPHESSSVTLRASWRKIRSL